MRIASLIAIWIPVQSLVGASLHEERFIFEPNPQTPEHVHASCIVECPNGDLLAVWYENGRALPAPYFASEKDKSDDVRYVRSFRQQSQHGFRFVRKTLAGARHTPWSTRKHLGWMPRSHPLNRSDGAMILPLANENFGIATMAISL